MGLAVLGTITQYRQDRAYKDFTNNSVQVPVFKQKQLKTALTTYCHGEIVQQKKGLFMSAQFSHCFTGKLAK